MRKVTAMMSAANVRRMASVGLLLAVGACGGGSKPPGSPTPQTASVTITVLTVQGTQSGTEYRYSVQLAAQNTGAAVATVADVAFTLTAPDGSGAVTLTDVFSPTTIAPGATATARAITLTDSTGRAFGTTLGVVIHYSDAVGPKSATRSADIPPLPGPTPPPVPTLVTLMGTVTERGAGPLSGAHIEIRDGPDDGKTVITDGAGRYLMPSLHAATITVRAWKSGYTNTDQRVTLTGTTTTANFSVPKSGPPPPPPPPAQPFTRSGSGANVFDIPSSVTRIRIDGSYGGSCENFVVWIAGDLKVNEILGTCSIASGTTFSGTYAIHGGTAEVQNSTGISWKFTQVK